MPADAQEARDLLAQIVEQGRLFAFVASAGVAGPWRPMTPDDLWPNEIPETKAAARETWVRPWVYATTNVRDTYPCAAYVYRDGSYGDWHFWCYEDADGGTPEREGAQRWCDRKAGYFTVAQAPAPAP